MDPMKKPTNAQEHIVLKQFCFWKGSSVFFSIHVGYIKGYKNSDMGKKKKEYYMTSHDGNNRHILADKWLKFKK